MAEKKLLEESEVRRWAKLANIKTLTESVHGQDRFGFAPSNQKKDRRQMAEELEEEGYHKMEEAEEEPTGEEGGEETLAPPEGGEEMPVGGEEEIGAEGGDLKGALEQIKDGLNKLLAQIEGAGGMEVDLDAGEETAPEMEEEGIYEELEEEGLHEELEEEGLHEELEESALEEELEEEGYKMEEKKHPAKGEKKVEEKKLPGKKVPAKHEKEKEEKGHKMEEALAEELTRRVTARLMAEMKKSLVKKGSTGPAAAAGKTGTTHQKAPGHKGSPVGKVGAPFEKKIAEKSTKHKAHVKKHSSK
jgi:hypothetical protein